MQSLPPSQVASTEENVLFSAPLGPRFKVGGVKMYLKSAISRTFCQGYRIIGARGANVVIVVVEDGCCSSGQWSFSLVRAWWCWCSPIERPSKAELTRARWLRSSRLDPQSALQQAFHQIMLKTVPKKR